MGCSELRGGGRGGGKCKTCRQRYTMISLILSVLHVSNNVGVFLTPVSQHVSRSKIKIVLNCDGFPTWSRLADKSKRNLTPVGSTRERHNKKIKKGSQGESKFDFYLTMLPQSLRLSTPVHYFPPFSPPSSCRFPFSCGNFLPPSTADRRRQTTPGIRTY